MAVRSGYPILPAAVAIALWLASPGAWAACSPFTLRNQVLELAGPAPFQSRNGEFSIELPFERQRVEFGSHGLECFYAINIDAPEGGHFSVEWVELEHAQPDAGFRAYWRDFLVEYLRRNFGSGGYEVVAREEFVDAQGRPALRYAGTGSNHNGGTGSIIGIATSFGNRMANVYTVFPRVVGVDDVPFESVEARAVAALAASVACDGNDLSVCGRAVPTAGDAGTDAPPPEG